MSEKVLKNAAEDLIKIFLLATLCFFGAALAVAAIASFMSGETPVLVDLGIVSLNAWFMLTILLALIGSTGAAISMFFLVRLVRRRYGEWRRDKTIHRIELRFTTHR